MYLMHKWWARKPHNVVAEYIKHYSKEGDIVLDPFVGSGVTAIEAIKIGRKAVAIDLDPIATFITRNTAIKVDVDKVTEIFKDISGTCKNQIEEMYKTNCRKCKKQAKILATIWDRDAKRPTEVHYFCVTCNKRYSKEPDENDIRILKKIEAMDVPYWYPKDKFPEGETFNQGRKEAGEHFYDLFTKRNLIALSILLHEIEKISDSRLLDMYKFAFTGITHLASKMCPVRPSRQFSSFWAMPSYWVPPIFMESNVWMLFNSKVNGKQGIMIGKQDSNSQIPEYKEAKTFKDLIDGSNIFIKTHNALELTKILPPNSIDYVFTDPPYGGSIPYFELSTLWALWLKMDIDYKGEITVNKYQKKDFDFYHRMLTSAFRQIYEVLKPGKYLTVTFHNKSIKIWTSIIKAVILAGFDLEKIIYQPPARPSSAGLLRPYGSAIGDYYLRFRKSEMKFRQTAESVSEQLYERVVVEAAKNIIAERGEPTPYTFILNGIIVELKKEGALLSGNLDPDVVMKKHIGTEFALVDVKDSHGKKVGQKWWFKDPSQIAHLERIPLIDRVESAIVDVLHSKVKVSFDDVLQYVFKKFPNALTPETEDVNELLSEYAEKTSDGNWIMKPIVKGRESEHTKLIFYLANMGKLAGFDVWIGQKEQGDIFNGERLGKLVTPKDPVWRFIPTHNLDRVKQIDVIWHDEGRIKYEFEVENTTAITEAIVRGSNIPHDHVMRLIVIPEEREGLLFRKMKEPLLGDRIVKDNWKFIFYKDVKRYFDKCKQTKKIDIKEFEKLFKIPKERKENQTHLKTFVKKLGTKSSS
jgi:16S rRNA G966 N2-methylase RsmD